ncbi:MAG: hypothetical protein GXO39_03760 [Thermotogae bacterium]|nr:hypothetical protein [Thermotogota bacterium]
MERKKDLEKMVRDSLRISLPDRVIDRCVEMMHQLESREVPQVALVEMGASLYFLVAAKDWAGLSNASLSAIHQKGYNLSFVLGIQVKGTSYSLMIMQLENLDEEKLKKLKQDRDEIVRALRVVARGNFDIRELLGSEEKKLQIYQSVRRILQRKAESGEISKKIADLILSEDGELVKFVRSRTKAYLGERSPETLAEIVIMQAKLIEKARRNPDTPHVSYHTFEVGRSGGKNDGKRKHFMVGYTIAGRFGLITLHKVLRIMAKNNIVTRFSKEFITPDGIEVVRVEIDAPKEQWKKKDLARKLENASNYLEKPRLTAPGEEFIGRMVIERLVAEYNSSGIPQLVVLPIEEDIYYVVAVGPMIGTAREMEHRLREVFTKRNLTILSPDFLKENPDKRLAIIKMRLQIPENVHNIHNTVKQALEEIYSEVRDFDATLRKKIYEKLSYLYEALRETIQRPFISSIFHSLKDSIRIFEKETFLAEVMNHIFSSVESYMEYTENKERKDDEKKTSVFAVDVGKRRITTVVSKGEVDTTQLREMEKEYGEIISHVKIYGRNAYTFMKELKE